MTAEKEYLLNELKEHTQDCDCARSQHFYDEKICQKKADRFNRIQSIVFLVTIAIYVLIVSGIQQNAFLNILGIILALASTLLEILSYMLRYEDEAREHWKAAQTYSELYRKCQFFYSNHMNSSVDVWREKLEDISQELSRISLLSPSVSAESFNDWAKYGGDKKYPVNKALYDLKTDTLTDAIERIKQELEGMKFEIYLFGSYLLNMHYNDIDIAVIVYENENGLGLTERMEIIEQDYSITGLNLDITVITEEDLVATRYPQFVNNICNGICYYKSHNVNKSIQDYLGVLTNYPEIVAYFMDQVKEDNPSDPYFVSNAFYMYYHALSGLLAKENIAWYGEKSLIMKCENFASNNDCMTKYGIDSKKLIEILRHTRLFFDKKEVIHLSEANGEFALKDEDRAKLVEYVNEDVEIIRGLMEKLK